MIAGDSHRLLSVLLVSCLLLVSGCSSSSSRTSMMARRRQGAKVNIPDLINNTAAYKGKTLSLVLKVDEAINRSQGQSLRDYLGRDVRFAAVGPGGEPLKLVVTIPVGLDVPEAGHADEVTVTFVCTRGDLRQGNEARSIER